MKKFNEFRLYEFEEKKKMTSPEQTSFMDNLFQKVKKEIMPKLPEQFRVDYDRGKSITIHTDNKNDLKVGAKVSDEKMIIFSKPVGEPEFEINFNFQNASIDNVINTIKGEFEKSESNGISTGKVVRNLPSYHDYEDNDEDNPEDNQEDIDIPIIEKPKRIKRSIDIKIIRNVLEDAYILDDIDLKQATIDELIRRMLIESRKK